MSQQTRESAIHYGWVIVAVGTLTIAACLGLARFAFGMLLPSMRDALAMSYDQMGFLGTANFTGYLAAVALAPLLLRRFSPRQMITGGLLLIAACMFAISASSGYTSVLTLYSLVGIGSGFANIPLMVLVSFWFRRERRGRAAGLMVIGSGFAIILSGFLIPWLNDRFGASGWRVSWLVLAGLVLLVAVIAAVLIRNDPAEKGLEPFGQPGIDYEPGEARGRLSVVQVLGHLGGLYFIFGATYVIYGTFIVTTMIEEYAFVEASAGLFWSWVGLFSLLSGILFGALSDRIGRKGGLMAVYAVQTVAYLLAGSKIGTPAIFASVVLYGVAMFAAPAIMAAAVGDYLGKARAAAAFSFITVCFAIGQTLGPAIAGILAERSGSFTPSYLASSALTALAILWAARLPAPETRH
ncbi:MAG: YbfB/YjiJ family MFS transporter [Desulfuromonadales bacterium]|nr:YbfB/YjiJ family MFS transporter [Desulfuromonadales bacterium]